MRRVSRSQTLSKGVSTSLLYSFLNQTMFLLKVGSCYATTCIQAIFRGQVVVFGACNAGYVSFRSSFNSKWLWINLANSSLGISFSSELGIELAYSHRVYIRLVTGLMSLNPVLMLLTFAMALIFGVTSFYYEWSYLLPR